MSVNEEGILQRFDRGRRIVGYKGVNGIEGTFGIHRQYTKIWEAVQRGRVCWIGYWAEVDDRVLV